jgi:hypothetical protein
VGHTGATDGLNECLLNYALLNVKGKLTCTLLRSAPADTVGKTGNIADLSCLDPLTLFGNGSGAVVRTLGNVSHVLNFVSNSIRTIAHFVSPLSFIFFQYYIIIDSARKIKTICKKLDFFHIYGIISIFKV